MAITYRIDAERGRLHMMVAGEFTASEIAIVLREVASSPELPDGFTAISDHSRVTRALTASQLLLVVSIMEEFPGRFAGVRWAVVSPRPAAYGMLRVLAARAQLALGMGVQIFFDTQRATEWLDSASEAHVPA